MLLAYHRRGLEKARCLGSHPDVVAASIGEEVNLDEVSLSEFIMTGRVTFPFTYYRHVQALEPGCVTTFDVHDKTLVLASKRRYFEFGSYPNGHASLDQLAQEFGTAFRNSVARRTLRLFGRTGVGLSGGLDSRVIVATAQDRTQLCAFHLYNEENAELRAARQLAQACKVEFVPLQRQFEYYGETAEQGVRISGGTGNISSNHFLGMADRLTEFGIENFLTGCYCDYLFKGLSLNTTEHRFTREERLAPFNFEFYRPCYWPLTAASGKVRERLEQLFPEAHSRELGSDDWINVERKRALPLAYEADLAQRVIPQRVFPWFLPVADRELLDVYGRIPSRFKLNSSLFRQMALSVCDQRVASVPDNNTGARLDASRPSQWAHRYFAALRNRITTKVFPTMTTTGSWPNWEYYLAKSKVIPSLWTRRNDLARGLFHETLGYDVMQKSPAEFRGRDLELFLRLLTQKLWLDQRTGCAIQ
jgi:asparagine synthetase B (glutamine-hydrolysing)